jgi:acyl-CoA thioester hydrolase
MLFEHIDEVRDSELDLQGIVNNSNYFVYLEHARHKALKSLGVDFKALHDSGVDLVVSKVTIKFKDSLKSCDNYKITSEFLVISPVRVIVKQEIFNINNNSNNILNNSLNTEAEFIITGVNNKTGKIEIPDLLLDKINKK